MLRPLFKRISAAFALFIIAILSLIAGFFGHDRIVLSNLFSGVLRHFSRQQISGSMLECIYRIA